MVHDGSEPVKILVLARTSGHVKSPLVLLDVHSMNHLKRQLEQTFQMFGGTSSPSLGNKTKCFGSEPIFDKCQTMKLTLSPISTSICSPLLAIFSGTKVSNCHPSARALNFSVCAGAWERLKVRHGHDFSGKSTGNHCHTVIPSQLWENWVSLTKSEPHTNQLRKETSEPTGTWVCCTPFYDLFRTYGLVDITCFIGKSNC